MNNPLDLSLIEKYNSNYEPNSSIYIIVESTRASTTGLDINSEDIIYVWIPHYARKTGINEIK